MALTYHIHTERALVIIIGSGKGGGEEWETFLSSLISDPAFERGFRFLEDRRGLAELPTHAEVERAARWIQDHRAELGRTRWAIVVDPASPAAFGMARVQEALTSTGPVTVRTFIDYEAALAWAQGAGDA
jgi:hypothetical protein